MIWLLVIIALLSSLFVWRSLRSRGILNKKRPKDGQNVALIVLGSGGHTMEMFKLMNGISQRFNKRVYVTTDELSKKKAIDFEAGYSKEEPEVIFTTRSRKIGQSILSAIPAILTACFESLSIVFSNRPNLILCNGPGTCIPICIVAFVFDLFRITDCKIIYVESVCRVTSLSLSGKILYYTRIYDGFLVQWPELKQKFSRTEFIGRLS